MQVIFIPFVSLEFFVWLCYNQSVGLTLASMLIYYQRNTPKVVSWQINSKNYNEN